MDGQNEKCHLEMDDDWGYPYDSGNPPTMMVAVYSKYRIVPTIFGNPEI